MRITSTHAHKTLNLIFPFLQLKEAHINGRVPASQPISNSQPLAAPTSQYFTSAAPSPSTPTWNTEEWFLWDIRVATAIVVLMILFIALIVMLCKCGRNSAMSQLVAVELQSL